MAGSRRRSPLWVLTGPEVLSLAKRYGNVAAMLRHLDVRPSAHAYTILRTRLEENGVNYAAFRKAALAGRPQPGPTIPLAEILIKNSTYRSRSTLKKRLIREGLLENKCQLCRLQPEWQGSPLVLIIDHINGTNSDNRLCNLRLLCPNCNSQTETFTGRNIPAMPPKLCVDCETPVHRKSARCNSCARKKWHSLLTAPR